MSAAVECVGDEAESGFGFGQVRTHTMRVMLVGESVSEEMPFVKASVSFLVLEVRIEHVVGVGVQ